MDAKTVLKRKAKADVLVEVKPTAGLKSMRTSRIHIIGNAPLVCNKFSQKMQDAMLAKHKGENTNTREAKDPVANYNAARYISPLGWDGIPAGGLKACLVAAGRIAGREDKRNSMASLKGVLRVIPNDPSLNLVRIYHDADLPHMNESVVRNADGSPDIRHRPEYRNWCMSFEVQYLSDVVSSTQLINLVQLAGFAEGLCEWRPGSKKSHSGHLGTFEIAHVDETRDFDARTLHINGAAILF